MRIFKRKPCEKCHGGKAEFSFGEMQYFPCSRCDGTGHEEPGDFEIWLLTIWSYIRFPRLFKERVTSEINEDLPF